MTQTTDGKFGSTFDELRVTTRIVGLLAILTAVVYLKVIVSGGFLLTTVSGNIPVSAILFMLMVIAAAGLVISHRWECLGGIIAILGAMSVATIVYAAFTENRLMAMLIFSSPFMISGILCLIDWGAHRNQSL